MVVAAIWFRDILKFLVWSIFIKMLIDDTRNINEKGLEDNECDPSYAIN